jgi:cysteinyl-tRNA synthetase
LTSSVTHPRAGILPALVVALAACSSIGGKTPGAVASKDSGDGGDLGVDGSATMDTGSPTLDDATVDDSSVGDADDGGQPVDADSGNPAAADAGDATSASHAGFPVGFPWVSFYGGASSVDLAKTAAAFRIVNIDVDPDQGNFTDAQIAQLQANGQNRVISYLNVGSCESFRSYWSTDPPGHKSCVNSGALTDAYQGYPNEKWADLSNASYHDLIVNYVAVRLAARGVDGFFLDNLEVVEHGTTNPPGGGPCDASCSQGGLDLVWELRQKFPGLLMVMQNATSAVTMNGTTNGVAYPSLLDGVSHEEVYSNGGDAVPRQQMLAWQALGLTVSGVPFWLATEEYVGACSAADKPAATAIYQQALADGLNTYVTDASGQQSAPCFWSDFP